MSLVLGIDMGTSFLKLALVDRCGRVRGLGRVAVVPDRGDGSLCEVPVDRFWAWFREALGQALRQADAVAADIEAASYASQANSFLLLDGRGHPVTPLILWPDVREAKVDAAVEALWRRGDFLQVTGFGVGAAPELVVSKIRWFQRARPTVWAETRFVMTISDYLLYCLTGQSVGDAGTASMLGILNQATLDWWPEALEMLEIAPDRLSRPVRPGTKVGQTAPDVERMGLPPGIPVAAGGMDHHMAALGAGLGRLGQLSESTGTVLACVHPTDALTPLAGATVGPDLGSGFYHLNWHENGANVLAWYQAVHAPEMDFPQLIEAAAAVPNSEVIPAALPCANRYPGLSGFVRGPRTCGHGPYVRAILESTAKSLAELVRQFYPSKPPVRIVATGGGARSDLWLQTYADHLGCEIVATGTAEPAALGAAMLAARAAGWFPSASEAGRAWVTSRKVFAPACTGGES